MGSLRAAALGFAAGVAVAGWVGWKVLPALIVSVNDRIAAERPR